MANSTVISKRVTRHTYLPKPYKEGTGLRAIVLDGWSRGFHPEQTVREARAMGYVASLEWVQAHWLDMDREMERYFAENPQREDPDFPMPFGGNDGQQ